MEKTLNDFSLGLLVWQIIIFVLFIAIIYFAVKFGKVFYNFLKKNS